MSPYVQLVSCPCCHRAMCEVDLNKMMAQIDTAAGTVAKILDTAMDFHKLGDYSDLMGNTGERALMYIKLINMLREKHELLNDIVFNEDDFVRGKSNEYLKDCVLRAEIHRQKTPNRFAPCEQMF